MVLHLCCFVAKKTAHSTFCIPLLINEELTCNITQGSLHAKLLIEEKLIIWDEVLMMNRLCFKAFGRTLRDILKVQKPFGGKVVVLGSDSRQILPFVKKWSRYDVVKSIINYSDLWKSCKVLKLLHNLRLNIAKSTKCARDIK